MPKEETRCCSIDAVVGIDSKGQIVLPKEGRERAGLSPGDKLAVISCGCCGGGGQGGEAGCIVLIKAETLRATVTELLGPMLKDLMAQ